MLFEVEKNIKNCDIFVSVAAVSDFVIKNKKNTKIKSDKGVTLEFVKNIDILKLISEKYNLFTVGFAAETNDLKENAIKKLKEKKISVIAANEVSNKKGIDNTQNSITLYWGNNFEKTLSLKNKKELAVEFVEQISNIYK